GLGAESYGSVIGNLTFGEGARLNVSWDDNFDALSDGWSNEYNLFGASSVTDWDNLLFEQSRIDTVGGWFTPTWHEGMLTLTYTSDVPEPATLAIIGLGLAGLGWARRRK
ncbi:MAG: PEP-CTERM sorting domain-containing protein, partial [Planctomycetaceae bacterium]|nr:PEP-CTERM sorting domain-containing protein [Planctomycetaceae bacterium]